MVARVVRMDGYQDSQQGDRRAPRVLILCAVDFTARRFLAPLARYLADRGLDVRVACAPGPDWEALQAEGLRMVRLPIARSWNVVSHLLTIWRLRACLKKHQVDILHVHTPVAGLLGRLVGRWVGVPLILYTAHGFYFHDRMGAWARRFHVLLERLGARFHDHLFLVSEEDAKAAEKYGIERPARTTVVRNGVSSQQLVPEVLVHAGLDRRAELGIPPEVPVVTMVGRLTREKGQVEFLRAARRILQRIPEAHFLVVGGTLASERDRIRRRIERMAADPRLAGHVHLLGFREDVPELLAASTLFVLPSWREGLPVSVLEAMMLGLPVVATNIRGCREAVVDGSTGLLVEPGSSEDLAGAVVYLLEHREIARRLGSGGRRRALELYDIASHLESQWNVYRRLIGEHLR